MEQTKCKCKEFFNPDAKGRMCSSKCVFYSKFTKKLYLSLWNLLVLHSMYSSKQLF